MKKELIRLLQHLPIVGLLFCLVFKHNENSIDNDFTSSVFNGIIQGLSFAVIISYIMEYLTA